MLVVARLDRLARSIRQLLTTDIGHSSTCSEIPSLTVAESWPSTMVSTVMLAVPQGPGTRAGWSSRLDWIEGWVSGAGGRLTH